MNEVLSRQRKPQYCVWFKLWPPMPYQCTICHYGSPFLCTDFSPLFFLGKLPLFPPHTCLPCNAFRYFCGHYLGWNIWRTAANGPGNNGVPADVTKTRKLAKIPRGRAKKTLFARVRVLSPERKSWKKKHPVDSIFMLQWRCMVPL